MRCYVALICVAMWPYVAICVAMCILINAYKDIYPIFKQGAAKKAGQL